MTLETSKESQAGILAQAQHYWHVLVKWKWSAITFLVICVVAVTVYSLIVTPIYTAFGTVWIEDDPNILPFEDVQSLGPGTNLSSYVRLLQSRSLASDTIEKLKLFDNPDFAGQPKNDEPRPDPANPVYREALIQSFLGSVTVTPRERTRLVEVSFSNRNPKLAADILNSMFDGFIEMIVSKRYAASEQATRFLNEQIAELRAEIEDREQKLNEYGSKKDILPLSTAEEPAVIRIGDVSRALTDATLERINRLNSYNQLKNAPLGEIPNAPEGSLIQRLREQYIMLSRQYATRSATVKPEYPEMQRLKKELDSATEALQNETQNLIRSAYGEYQAALLREQSLKRLLDQQKNDAYRASSDSVIYNSLRVELDNRKALLDALSKRQSETDVSSRLKGLEALNVWIVDKADYPLSPVFPKKRRNVIIGFLVGLAGGIGLALGIEYLNQMVKTSRDITKAVGIPTLGTVPSFDAEIRLRGPWREFANIRSILRGKVEQREARPRRKQNDRESKPPTPRWMASKTGRYEEADQIELITIREPRSIQSESYRSIRTTLLVSSPPGRIKTMLFTSPLAREGKSSTVSNLGVSLAEASKRVVIVDADLRKPHQANIFGTQNAHLPGLSSYLSSNIDEAEILHPTKIPNLQLIMSGPLPASPIELLTSERMDILIAFLKRSFDYILLDTPPLLAVSDALAMGPVADAILMVVRGGQTPVSALKQAKQKLDIHKLKCLGIILNGVDLIEQDGMYAKQYYDYSKRD